MDRIPFFRAGTHTTTSGHDLSFSEAEVAQVAEVYDPDVHEAPIVVGHPSDDDPAYGWAEDVEVQDGLLAAMPRKVEPQFEEMVKSGRFEKVSAKFYPPGHDHHPLGEDSDAYYLRHIGFLGAQPPAIKGLPSLEFEELGDDLVAVEASFSEPTFAEMPWYFPGAVRDVFRRLREYLVANEGVETADEVVPQIRLDDLEQIEDEAEMEDHEGGASTEHESGESGSSSESDSSSSSSSSSMNYLDAFLRTQLGEMLSGSDKSRSDVVEEIATAADIETSTVNDILAGNIEAPPEERLQGFSDVLGVSMDEVMEAMGEDAPEEFAEQNEVLSEKEERLQQREEELEKRERAQRREEATQFVEEHIGAVTPGHKDTVVETLVMLDDQDVQVQFGEGENAEETPVGEALRGFIEALPEQIEFSEVTAEAGEESEARLADDSAYARKLTEKAMAFKEEKAEEGITVTIDEAVNAVKEDFDDDSLD
jgi:transcriptional regulator with XRE-family HTH domain